MLFPAATLTHLPAAELAAHRELVALARLEEAGVALGVVVLPSAIEESFYRLNNLPRRLAGLYEGLDPSDPDEDIVEEVESAALRLVSESFLLDDVIDAVYASLAGLSGPVRVRRPGWAGEVVMGARAALLAVKRTFRNDWTVKAVLERLEEDGRLGVEARPVLVHGVDASADPMGAVASTSVAMLGPHVHPWVDASGAITRVGWADDTA
jgi:hypothetical protein